MNTTEAAHLARRLMNQHGLGHVPFEYDRAVRRFGQTRFYRGIGGWQVHRITLSVQLTANCDESQVRNVILHEIAHAMVGPDAGHGPKWVRAARSIGCTGSRCTEVGPEQRVQPKWKAVCPSCTATIGHRHRRPRNGTQFSCVPCRRVGIESIVRWVMA